MNIFHCSDHVHARTFIRVISTLPQLRKLSLFSLGNNISASFIMKFFKCLPPSLELLQLRHYILDDVGDLAELAVEGDADFGIEPLAERPGPLTNLTDLSLPSHDESYTVEQIESILQHCPSLTKLVIPQHLPLTVGAGGRFIEMIQDHCPLVRGWTILQPNGTNPEDRETLLDVLDTLPLNQVESLAWREYTEQDTVLAEGATADTDPAAVVIVNASIDINRGGFLSLLGGLTHLEELRGSIHLATRNFSNVFSNVEVDWIQSHWPRLRFVEFYMQATMDQANLARDIPEPVLRLKNEMHV
ncbi:hypothetical protein BGX33_007276 [Mortierella sp. NVP41]|nr:hypothetical protein BGX33_007276 [Mortierella sp. NVP41]